MNTTSTTSQLFSETAALFGDLLRQQTKFGIELLQILGNTSSASLDQMMSSSTISDIAPKMKSMVSSANDCGCKIPPPCWMPQSIGEIDCHVCPGGTASIRLRITNCGSTGRQIKVESAGKTSGVSIIPADVSLGSMERGYVTVSVPVSAEMNAGQEFEVLVWVRGCREHYLRWTIKVATRGADCCHEIEVEDCPDLIHHWYDHFYCQHPCLETTPGTIFNHG